MADMPHASHGQSPQANDATDRYVISGWSLVGPPKKQ